MSSISNQFGKKTQVKTDITQSQTKKDATRENVKKTLLNSLEKKKDGNSKFSSEKIALEIEEEIYKQNNNNSKCKEYREKIRKIELRIKGTRNLFIREILKNGLIDIKTFCELDEKTLNNDNYFNNLKKDNINENENKNNKDDNLKNNNLNKGNININNKLKVPMRTARPPSIKVNIHNSKIENFNNNDKNIENNSIQEKKNVENYFNIDYNIGGSNEIKNNVIKEKEKEKNIFEEEKKKDNVIENKKMK
jgi:hypothetical protein